MWMKKRAPAHPPHPRQDVLGVLSAAILGFAVTSLLKSRHRKNDGDSGNSEATTEVGRGALASSGGGGRQVQSEAKKALGE